MYLDPLYFVFALPGLILALGAQFLVWLFYSIYSGEPAGSGITGLDAANIINEKEGFGVDIVLQPGKLNDFFNPLANKVNLSEDNQLKGSVANIAVVAHEFGHVEQKYKASSLMKIRTGMVPAVNIGSNLGYILIIIGLIFSITGLAWIGLAFFSLTALFSLITLPIEFDASRRGLKLIKKHNLIATGKLSGARLVLFAAALTYVAALVQSLGQILYFLMLIQGKNRD